MCVLCGTLAQTKPETSFEFDKTMCVCGDEKYLHNASGDCRVSVDNNKWCPCKGFKKHVDRTSSNE